MLVLVKKPVKKRPMPTPSDTAYPRIECLVSDSDDLYIPKPDETRFAEKHFSGHMSRVFCLILLKSFQRLGYFPGSSEIPQALVEHICECTDLPVPSPKELDHQDRSGGRQRTRIAILAHLGVKAFSQEANALIRSVMEREVEVKDDLVDLINVAIEELIRNRYELPGFSTLLELAQKVRASWNGRFFSRVATGLSDEEKALIDEHLIIAHEASLSSWQDIKTDPGNPTLTQLKLLIEKYKNLSTISIQTGPLVGLPRAKIERFSAEAKALDISKVRRIQPAKRYALALCLFHTTRARSIDDLAEMHIKRMRKAHRRAAEELEEFRRQNQKRVDGLIARLGAVAKAIVLPGGTKRKLERIEKAIGPAPEKIVEACELMTAYADNNYYPFVWKNLKSHRQSLFEILRHVELRSTSQDTKLIKALEFMLAHADDKDDWTPIYERNGNTVKFLVDLSFIPPKWRKAVPGLTSHDRIALKVERKHFEACVFTVLSQELQSGDIAVVGADRFSDYRSELVSDDEYSRRLSPFAKILGLPVDRPKQYVSGLKESLRRKILEVDASFPENTSIRFENGAPVLTKAPRRPEKKCLSEVEEMIRKRLAPVTILDILSDTDDWLRWSEFFKPVSGQGARIKKTKARYLATAFCYGCGLGPTQMAKSLKAPIDKHQISWVHHHHVSEAALDKAITSTINTYGRFELPKLWGSGKSVSADGTKWDVGARNLLSEYHIRYGGYGGIGYYHTSDTYIALFSRFIPCGVWEAVYILDGLLANESETKPDTVHGDTQAQNTPVFALSHLLGIKLMPRIRNWKDLRLYKPTRSLPLKHLDALFADEVINWDLIERHMPDMIRVVLSIQAGKIAPSTILRKLSTQSRKNRLYFAFRELGRVIRTLFLLDFITSPELRAIIQGCTNKSEAFNGFIDWLDFGGAGLKFENDRDEQRKLIKYNHLVANLVILHNVQSVTEALNALAGSGVSVDVSTLSQMSPYLTGHINRFGDYRIDQKRRPRPLRHDLRI